MWKYYTRRIFIARNNIRLLNVNGFMRNIALELWTLSQGATEFLEKLFLSSRKKKKKDKKKKNGEGKNIWVVFKLAINTIRMINSVIFKDIFY